LSLWDCEQAVLSSVVKPRASRNDLGIRTGVK
jgi:hypothetical protein